jgi:hypothetical protein
LGRLFDPHAWSCWHLPREVYRTEFGIEVPPYGVERGAALSILARLDAFEHARHDGLWRPVEVADERFGDLVTFFDPRLPRALRDRDSHVGMVIARRTMIHVPEHEETTVERYDGLAWGMRCLGLYRHRDLDVHFCGLK